MEFNSELWNKLKQQAGDALGPDFWRDIARLMPATVPRADMFVRDAYVYVTLELPGLESTRDVQLSTNGKQLRIKGRLHYPYPVDEERLALHERKFGPFDRQIALPAEVYPQHVQASYRNGLLTVMLRMRPDHPETAIPIFE